MVRNFQMRKRRPPRPTRSWRKSAGPGEVSRTSAADGEERQREHGERERGDDEIEGALHATRARAERAHDRADGRGHAILLGVGHRRVERQRDHALPLGAGDGEVVGAEAVALPVVRVQVQRHPVDAGADAGARELLDEGGAIDAEAIEAQPDDVEVPGRAAIGALDGQLELVEIAEERVVARGEQAAAAGELARLAQLDAAERGGEVGEVVLEAGRDDA